MSCGKSLVLFGVGPGPGFVLFAFASRGETQIWLGDLRVVCRFVVLFCFSCSFSDLPLLFYRGTTAFHCEIFNSFDTFTPIFRSEP